MNIADQKIQINKKGCACAISLELLGDKWTILVVRDLLEGKLHLLNLPTTQMKE